MACKDQAVTANFELAISKNGHAPEDALTLGLNSSDGTALCWIEMGDRRKG